MRPTIIGKRFGKLVVINHHSRNARGVMRYLCHCDCGLESLVYKANLERGSTKSCGCGEFRFQAKHGLCDCPEYRAWRHMKERCSNPNNTRFDRYGGRGISVCREWKCDFMAFLRDMGRKPSPRHTLERINNDGNYCKENCRWAMDCEQSLNTCRNRILYHDGRRQPVILWSKELGINKSTLYKRITRSGWETSKALTTHVQKRLH
jgi:hypothetical protein